MSVTIKTANTATSTATARFCLESRVSSSSSTFFSHQLAFPIQRFTFSGFKLQRDSNLVLQKQSCGAIRVVDGGESTKSSPWDDKPYEILAGGRRSYLDVQDVVTFLDPPKDLIPLDPASYNPASYLCLYLDLVPCAFCLKLMIYLRISSSMILRKKIDDIPEERRGQLLYLLKSQHISRAWEVAGSRYEDPKLVKRCSSSIFHDGNCVMPPEFWKCRTSGGPRSWRNVFRKAVFRCDNGVAYGRFIAGSGLSGILSSFHPLYFVVQESKEVMATEEPCDLAYKFGNGQLDLENYPLGFPKPAIHPWPFNDEVVIYIRHLGPGVLVGQAWQEGRELEQVPKKLCNEILMIKDYAAPGESH
ncbi:hypothetical protein RJ641_031486 [Dillenia turbinata]|uniref:Uncharacterized protein n=1 Tax=Dillenia turbinata TaxID=194707 RepID=A0AAN8W114_9MAGN